MKIRAGTIALLAALFTAIGLLFFSYHLLDDLARHHGGTALPRFIEEMTGAYAAVVILPIVLWISRRFPLGRHWPAALVVQFGGLVLYTIVHTTLMALSRAALFPLAGLGSYNYGVMLYRYPMEASQDAIFYSITVGFVYVFSRLRIAREAEVQAAKLRTELTRAQLDNLRLQLHPHFLFNTLNAVSSVMYEDVAKADTMLAQLSDFLRMVLESGGSDEVPLERELAVEQTYVAIMKTRFENRLNVVLEVEPQLRDAAVPFMLLQPLLENSIKHGLASDSAALDIEIQAHRERDTTVIAIRDNGIGLGGKAVAERHGLRNVRSRLANMYGEAAAFCLGPASGGGTLARLTIPYAATPSRQS
ncbi:MAG: histidine kinase [Candidatus Eremiobacteraeota bacterium]|nr:histidine kinase [Candidatus Eremiobacteraeota bacterium]MBV9057275.1 histidine kinase [Candidatus Eremiobacteraeota bacterium]MBV9700448.1 histidine kinase [Candidatus Eremiobacteraeota bacterium]